MMETLISLYPTLKALWVVCFLLVFLGMLWLVLRPSRKRAFEAAALIPLRDDAPPTSPRRDKA